MRPKVYHVVNEKDEVTMFKWHSCDDDLKDLILENLRRKCKSMDLYSRTQKNRLTRRLIDAWGEKVAVRLLYFVEHCSEETRQDFIGPDKLSSGEGKEVLAWGGFAD